MKRAFKNNMGKVAKNVGKEIVRDSIILGTTAIIVPARVTGRAALMVYDTVKDVVDPIKAIVTKNGRREFNKTVNNRIGKRVF